MEAIPLSRAIRLFVCLFAACLIPVAGALAQNPPPAPSLIPPQFAGLTPPTDDIAFFAAALSEFLSDSRAFTASAELQLPAQNPADALRLPFGVAMADGRMRWEFDGNRALPGQLPPELMDTLKQLGFDRFGLILRPAANMTLILHSARAYADMPMPKNESLQQKADAQVGRLEKTAVGEENLDGHPCTKFRVANPQNKDGEAVVWQAHDLKELPVQIRIKISSGTYQFKFRNVHMGKPDVRLFDPPPGYSRYASIEALLQDSVMKSIGQALPGLGKGP